VTTATNTEENILEAARKVFMQKGFAATRMCDIARTADINQALLHYYFRNKNKLFMVIFEQETKNFQANILSILRSEHIFFDKIRFMVETEIQKISLAPYLPMFILSEMHSNPERMEQSLGGGHQHAELFNTFRGLVEKEYAAGRIRKVCSFQLFMSILGLTMFPFLAQPMAKRALNINDHGFDQLISDRAQYASDMLIQSLRV